MLSVWLSKSSMTFWLGVAELGKTAGKDALEDKPTYVSLLGLEKAKELAEEQYLVAAKAVEGLSEGLSGKERLIEIADFIIKRTH